MARNRVRGGSSALGIVLSAARIMHNAKGVAGAQLLEILGRSAAGRQKNKQRVLKRAVTEGYLMRKNNKFYFIPRGNMNLPALVVMRRTGRRSKRRTRRRTRSSRRSDRIVVEPVQAARRRRSRRRRRGRQAGAAGTGTPNASGASTSQTPSTSTESPAEGMKEDVNDKVTKGKEEK